MKLLEREVTTHRALRQAEHTPEDPPEQPPGFEGETSPVTGEEVGDDPSAPAPAKTKRILVVDDEELVLRSLRRILIASGYEALVAASGQQGLDLARKTPPDL